MQNNEFPKILGTMLIGIILMYLAFYLTPYKVAMKNGDYLTLRNFRVSVLFLSLVNSTKYNPSV